MQLLSNLFLLFSPLRRNLTFKNRFNWCIPYLVVSRTFSKQVPILDFVQPNLYAFKVSTVDLILLEMNFPYSRLFLTFNLKLHNRSCDLARRKRPFLFLLSSHKIKYQLTSFISVLYGPSRTNWIPTEGALLVRMAFNDWLH